MLKAKDTREMAALITGGAGFIGSNIAQKLVGLGYKVRIIDNLATGRRENIAAIEEEVDFIEGDITDLEMVVEGMDGIDLVFHEAALPSVPRSIADPISSNEANIKGTLNVLIAARDKGVKRLVYASSSSVYGDAPELPKVETIPVNPLSPYALTKYAGEKYCQLFYALYDLETVCLRYFNVFGPNQDPSSQYAAVIPKFITAMLEGEPITIFGDGEQTRDFTYVDNVVEANILAAFSKKGIGEVFNIAYGNQISINDLVAFLQKNIGVASKIQNVEARRGEVRDSLAQVTKAKNELGYDPKIDVYQGLKKCIEWYRKKKA